MQETEDGPSLWHWGDNGSGFHCYVVGFPRQRLGVIVFTNGLGGHGIIPEVVASAVGGRHPAFAWLGYERWDSPARTWFKDILARGQAAVAGYPERRPGDSGPAITEEQVNRVGYWLLAKKKVKEAVAVFERNAADFPPHGTSTTASARRTPPTASATAPSPATKNPLPSTPPTPTPPTSSANSRPLPPPTDHLPGPATQVLNRAS